MPENPQPIVLPSGARFIPPVGVCAVCHKPLAARANFVRVTIRRHVSGQPSGNTWRIHACNDAHLSDALERLSRAIDERIPDLPPGSPAWAQRHGVLVTGGDE